MHSCMYDWHSSEPTSKASLRECILIRSRSLLSSRLRLRSLAEIPDFLRRRGCAPAWLVVEEQLSFLLGRGWSCGGSWAMADRSTAPWAPLLRSLCRSRSRSPPRPPRSLRSLPELSDPSAQRTPGTNRN